MFALHFALPYKILRGNGSLSPMAWNFLVSNYRPIARSSTDSHATCTWHVSGGKSLVSVFTLITLTYYPPHSERGIRSSNCLSPHFGSGIRPTVIIGCSNKKLSYRRETARQLHTSFSAHSLIVHFTEHRICFTTTSHNRLAKLESTLSANKPCDIRTLSWIGHSRSFKVILIGAGRNPERCVVVMCH